MCCVEAAGVEAIAAATANLSWFAREDTRPYTFFHILIIP